MKSKSSHRRPVFETLESRCVPAGNITTNSFANFGASDFSGKSVAVHLRSQDFTLPGRFVRLGLTLSSPTGSTSSVDTVPVEIQAIETPPFRVVRVGRSQIVEPVPQPVAQTLFRRADMPGGDSSFTAVAVTTGSYRVQLPANIVPTNWTLSVSLLGDVNGDYRVNAADLDELSSCLGSSIGQANYVALADINADGTIDAADQQLIRTNLGAATSVRPLTLSASLSTASDANANGVVLKSRNIVIGQTQAGNRVQFDLGADGIVENQAKAGNSGSCAFATNLPLGQSLCQVTASDDFGQRRSLRREVTRGDVVLDWNRVQLDVIRLTSTPPPRAARNLAMASVAMFDAINAVVGRYQSYNYAGAAAPGTSAEYAGAYAAYNVLLALYPTQKVLLDSALAETSAIVPDSPGKTAAADLGKKVADAVLTLRSNDGSNATVTYTPGSNPGDWQRTPPANAAPLLPQWPGVTPFAISSGDAYRPEAPPELDSAAYAADFNQVKELGRSNSTTRTAEQTTIAKFWADGGGTFTPPGHWNQIAADVASARRNSLIENARMFALLNVALADAGISCWDAKYHYNFWRPITAIARANEDGNDATTADSTWKPLLVTPPFPSYTSGHSTFSGAASTVLAALFGDQTTFQTRADPAAGLVDNTLGVPFKRSFTSFTQAADEAGLSRIYGGIHFAFDSTAGLAAGRSIGTYVIGNIMRPLS